MGSIRPRLKAIVAYFYENAVLRVHFIAFKYSGQSFIFCTTEIWYGCQVLIKVLTPLLLIE